MDEIPIGEVIGAWEDLGPTRRLPSSEPRRRPSAKAMEITGKLGLRYPPANSVDRDAHAARVALLAEDCADIPEDWLDYAVSRWAKEQPFFPRTCELRDLALKHGRALTPALSAPVVHAAPYWAKHIADRDRKQFVAQDWAELNEYLEKMGATARYSPDGTRYFPA